MTQHIVLSKHFYISMFHPKINCACSLLLICACKSHLTWSIYSHHVWVKWCLIYPLPPAFRVLMCKSQEIWILSFQKLNNEVLHKNVNFYKYIRKRGKRSSILVVTRKNFGNKEICFHILLLLFYCVMLVNALISPKPSFLIFKRDNSTTF